MTTDTALSAPSTGRGWTIGLWVAQVGLAAMFGMAGFNHAAMPIAALASMGMGWAADAPEWLVRFIGIAEIAGALGVILPAATRILPFLTPLAAMGFVIIQVLAIGVHGFRGEFAVLPFNLVLLAVALFVAWGRSRKAPIAARA